MNKDDPLYLIVCQSYHWGSLYFSFFLLQGNTRDVVAIKCIQKSSLSKTATENLLTEIELLKKLDHEHIVKLKDFEVSVIVLIALIFLYVNHNYFRRKLFHMGLFEARQAVVYTMFVFMETPYLQLLPQSIIKKKYSEKVLNEQASPQDVLRLHKFHADLSNCPEL